jgi:hypothetical protein
MKLQARHGLVFLVALAACGGASASGPAPATPSTAGALDGTSYDVVLEFPAAPAEKDTLRFANQAFESTACTGLGFPRWTPYGARQDAGATTFHVKTVHPSGTTMDWTGSVKGDAVDGTVNRTMNGHTEALPFKGARHS